MPKSAREDSRLLKLTKICLALPEATREIMGKHAVFKVRKKTFTYFLDDHHGDGIVCVTCKVMPGDNVSLSKSNPALAKNFPIRSERRYLTLRW